jgi:hypothetical protein
MPYVNSSAIGRIEHNPQTLVLSIWFHESGGPYDYFGVPVHVYDAFLSAASIGRYFNDHIREQYSVNR